MIPSARVWKPMVWGPVQEYSDEEEAAFAHWIIGAANEKQVRMRKRIMRIQDLGLRDRQGGLLARKQITRIPSEIDARMQALV